MISALLLAAGESTRMGTLKALLEWEGTTLLEYQVAQLRAARVGEVVVVLGHEAERLRPLLEGLHPSSLPLREGVGRSSPFVHPVAKPIDSPHPEGEGEAACNAGGIPTPPSLSGGTSPPTGAPEVVPLSMEEEVATSEEEVATSPPVPLSVSERGNALGGVVPDRSPFPSGKGDRGLGPPLRVVYNPEYRSGKTSSIRAGVAALSAEATGVLILGVDQPRPRDLLDYLIDRHGDACISVPVHNGRRGHPPIFARTLFSDLLAISEEREGLREVLRAHAADVDEIPVNSALVHLNFNRPEDYAAARR